MDIEKIYIESPTFETERLFLRSMTEEDVNDYFRFASDAQVSVHTVWNAHQTIEESSGYLKYLIQKQKSKLSFHWGIIDKETERLIGRTGFINWDISNERSEIGFGISSNYWKKGIIVEATLPIIEYGFKKIAINRIEGRCNHNNYGSGRAMEKLEMKFEGILREQLKVKGKFVDQKIYSILKSDFDV